MFMPGWEWGVWKLNPVLPWNTQPCPPMEVGTGDVYARVRVGSVNTKPCPPMEAGTGDVYVWVRIRECEHSTLSSHGSRDWWCLCLGESGECEHSTLSFHGTLNPVLPWKWGLVMFMPGWEWGVWTLSPVLPGSRDWWCLCLGESGECEHSTLSSHRSTNTHTQTQQR